MTMQNDNINSVNYNNDDRCENRVPSIHSWLHADNVLLYKFPENYRAGKYCTCAVYTE